MIHYFLWFNLMKQKYILQERFPKNKGGQMGDKLTNH